jgi:uncharacterized cupredoxin-like copper-binding protein
MIRPPSSSILARTGLQSLPEWGDLGGNTGIQFVTSLLDSAMPSLRSFGMNLVIVCLMIVCCMGLLGLFPSIAQAAPVAQPITEVRVHLSNSDNELKFVPDRFEFQAGKRYKLILDNPSSQKHYFTAKDFADSIWTQKVEAGNVEIKGSIRELELKPGATAEWVFVPQKPGTYEVRCPIAGHTEAGMKGVLSVSS